MQVKIIRPDIPEEKWKELESYLLSHYERAEGARKEQVEDKYAKWEANYYGIPAEKVRTVPWYKSSNFVVKVIRIFVDTFVARTLNIIFATRPLYSTDGFPRELKESLELYLNRKALNEWDHYLLAKDMLGRGNKNGTAVCKTYQLHESEIDVMEGPDGEQTENDIITYSGPRSQVIPFEDFCVYPITCNYLHEAVIKFHKVRYVEETAKRMLAQSKWKFYDAEKSDEDILNEALQTPQDAKRATTQSESGVSDAQHREMEVIECYLKWELQPGKYYSIIASIVPACGHMVDLYFNPYPRNIDIFTDYRPFPKEDFIFGESMCELLEQSQEEASVIHNDRRNNNFIANAPVFKRRSGSNLPNPSTNWYPGKVFDVEDMDDFEMVLTGRNYNDTLMEEQACLQLAERLSGIGPLMQGMSSGNMGKKGMYNTGGTLAVLSEGNQRQDTNIRDFRQVLSRIAKVAFSLQSYYGKDDPTIGVFPEAVQAQIRQALEMATTERLHTTTFEVKTSNAGSNSEVAKASLMQMAAILGQYGNTVQGMTQALANPQLNPSIRAIMMETITMHKWMAARLLRSFDEYDAEGVLPDVNRAIELTIPGGAGKGVKSANPGTGQAGMEPGGSAGAGGPLTREGLQQILAMVPPSGGSPQ